MQIIKNFEKLAINFEREAILSMLEEGLRAVDPKVAIKRSVKLRGERLIVEHLNFDISKFNRIIVIGAGKASGAMAEALERILEDKIEKGCVIVPKGLKNKYKVKRIELLEGDHPIPSYENVNSAKKIIECLGDVSREDLVICLISGGGSALLTFPVKGISLESVQRVSSDLMLRGADIYELNIVRKHLSAVKGGKLAKKAYPATLISLIISDVVGDDPSTIASGPTVPDPSTYKEAVQVLKRRGVWDNAPKDVKEHLISGASGRTIETPKPGDPIFERVYNLIIASNIISLKAMARSARELGFRPLILTSMLEGEAREVGKALAAIAKDIDRNNVPIKRPAAILVGGETTVTVTGKGVGGRNQELALSFSIAIRGLKKISAAFIGSDGIDGPTDAAGAIVDGETYYKAIKLGIDPLEYLSNNDSYTFFKKLGDLIITGPTGTNVNDLGAIALS